MSKDNMEWLEQFKAKEDANNKVKADVTKKIIKALKGVDRVTCLPEILANVFEAIEHERGIEDIDSFNNQIVNWGLETYAGRKISNESKNLLALYNYCVDEEYTEDNTWEWGGGDRCVCYIPNETKKVLLFENQNIKFVVVFDGYKVNVREVYRSIEDDNSFYSFKGQYFNSTAELREGLKSEKGLEIAMCNLMGKYTRFSNCVEGNEYPDKIDLDTMKKSNFDKTCPAFRYGDNRDSGYLMSFYGSKLSILSREKCELNDLRRADYAFHDMAGAGMEIPKSYLKALKREESVNKIINKKES